jgi:hypothetical protein
MSAQLFQFLLCRPLTEPCPVRVVVARLMLLACAGLYIEHSIASVAGCAPPDQQKAAFLLSGVKTSRDSLRSGAFRATGRHSTAHGSGRRRAGDVEIFAAFDIDRDRNRFDRREDVGWERGNAPREVAPVVARFVRTAAETLHFNSLGGPVFVASVDERPGPFVKAFDIRAIGMGTLADLEAGSTFEELLAQRTTAGVSMVKEDGRDVFVLEWKFVFEQAPPTVLRLWIDEAHGYSPIKCEVVVPTQSDSPAAGNPITERLHFRGECSWTVMHGVWVPTAFSAEVDPGGDKSEGYDLAFDWEGINQPLPDTLFTIASLEAPPHERVVDRKLGRGIDIGSVEDVVGPARTAPSLPVANGSGRTIWVALVGVGIAIVCVIVALRWLHRRSQRATR